MAEEKLDIPEKIELKTNHARRNSTGNLSFSLSGVKALPRYLSGSLGSCHDLCKYGIEHMVEEKAMSCLPKGITARPGEAQDQVKDVNLEERKKKLLINQKSLPDSKSQMPNKHEVNKKEARVSAKKVAVSAKHFSSPVDRMDVCANHVIDLRPKPVQSKPFSLSKPGNRSSRRYSEIIMSKGVGVVLESPVGGSRSRGDITISSKKEMRMPELRKKKDLIPPTVSLSPRPSVKRELSAKSGNYKDPNKVSCVKSLSNVRKAETRECIDEVVAEKTLYVIETKPQNPDRNGNGTIHCSQFRSPSSKEKNMECGRNGIRSCRSTPSFQNKELRRSRNGSHTDGSYSSSSLSSREKGLRHTQNGNNNALSASLSSSSSSSLLSSSSYAPEPMISDESDPISGGSRTKNNNGIQNHKVDGTIRPKKVGRVNLEDEAGSPQKLNFRRGKVVDVLSENNTSPRKLGFKQGRVLGENENGKADTELRSLKKVVADELSSSITEPKKVVLRHRDVEGKKGGQSLFNSVIKETASKLVQTRKSKVRALVDAFETVISLQDTKSSAATHAFCVASG